MSAFVPKPYFDEALYSNAVSAVVSGVGNLLRTTAPKTLDTALEPQSRDSEVSVFDVLALVLKDESLAAASTGVSELELPLTSIMKTKADKIRK